MAGFDDWVRAPRPAAADLCFTRGDTWELCFVLRDLRGRRIDVSAFTGVLQLYYSDAGQPAGTGAVDVSGGADGTVVLSFTDTQTAALPFTGGYYRVRLTDGGGRVASLMEGRLNEYRVTQIAGCGLDASGCGPGSGLGSGGSCG